MSKPLSVANDSTLPLRVCEAPSSSQSLHACLLASSAIRLTSLWLEVLLSPNNFLSVDCSWRPCNVRFSAAHAASRASLPKSFQLVNAVWFFFFKKNYTIHSSFAFVRQFKDTNLSIILNALTLWSTTRPQALPLRANLTANLRESSSMSVTILYNQMSAFFKAGASLTPSPVIPLMCFLSCNLLTISYLCSAG